MKTKNLARLCVLLLIVCTITAFFAACNSGSKTTKPSSTPSKENTPSSEQPATPSKGDSGDNSSVITPSNDDPIPSESVDPECEHVTVLDPAVAPTCTKAGKSEGSHCGKCGGVLVAQTEIPAIGHNWSEATCESPKTCSVCSATEGDAKGHDWQDASCITPKTCKTCGKTDGEAAGHNYKDGFCTACGVGKPSEGLAYTESGSGYVVSGIGTCRDANLVIPEEHEGEPVVGIADGAFKALKKIASLYVPGSVKTIGEEAFLGCTGLTKITLCEGITAIDAQAFAECTGIEEIVVPKSVSNLGTNVFYECTGLTKATLSAKNIASYTFSGCANLETVVLTDGVKTIDEYAFEYCFGLQSVSFPAGLTTIGESAFVNCAALKNVSLPDSVTTIETGAFVYCTALESCNLPAGLKTLGEYAFSGTGLKSVIIPASITEMGEGVFEECEALEKITFAAGVTKIPAGAFAGIAGLKEIVVPESVLTIEEGAFGNCTGLKTVTFSEGLTTIGEGAFEGCSALMAIEIPESVTLIEENAFKDCAALEAVTFKNSGWTELAVEDYAFSGTALTSVTIPEGMTTVSAAFSGLTTLQSVTLHDAVTAITDNAFSGCSGLTSISIPGGVTSISKSAFQGCSGLKSITIPSSVTVIGKFAFYGCSGLTEVVVPDSVTQIGWGAFGGCESLKEITLPFVGYKDNSGTASWDVFGFIFGDGDLDDTGAYSKTEYGMASGYTSQGPSYKRVSHKVGYITYYDYFYNYYAIPTSLRKVTITKQQNIPDYAFDNCTLLTEIILPEGVKNIGNYVFNSCHGIRSTTLGKDLESIGNGAFYDCSHLFEVINLSKLNIEAGVYHYSYIGEYAKVVHSGPSRISNENGYLFYIDGIARFLLEYEGEDTDLILPEGITHIGSFAFQDSNLTSIVIPYTVISIGEGAFKNCDNLTSVVIPDSVTSIGDYSFSGCDSLTRVSIGKGVTSIGNYAFSSCSMTSIVIPNSVTSMGYYVFYSCDNLTTVWCEASAKPAGWDDDWDVQSDNWIIHVVDVSWGYVPVEEPDTPYSTEWLEWLTQADMGKTTPMITDSGLYKVKYGSMTASGWELWPYTPADGSYVEDTTRFHLMFMLDADALDDYQKLSLGSANDVENYKYTWKTFYRLAGSGEEYKCVTGNPWSAVTLDDDVIYRLPLMDFGMKKPNTGDTYHMIFFIYNEDGTMVGWTDQLVDWTNSSEAYYQDALKYDLIG